MATTINNGSTHLDLSVTVEPLLVQNCDERGEEGSGQGGVKDGLDVYNGGTRVSPLSPVGTFPRETLATIMRSWRFVCSQSNRRLSWTSTIKGGATAENRPACFPRRAKLKS